VLRKRFKGQPEHVINYFFFVAESARADGRAGLPQSTNVGGPDILDRNGPSSMEGEGPILDALHKPDVARRGRCRHLERQLHPIDELLDRSSSRPPAGTGDRRAVTSRRSAQRRPHGRRPCCRARSPRRYGHGGLPDDTFVKLTGTAGQSFGAWLAAGVTLTLEGEANDYVGKGLSGGKLIIRPPANSRAVPERSIIVGNTVLTGRSRASATSAASPGSALPCATPEPSRWSRAPATTAANT
jgi:glutamate synthase (NADPH/NADH) large chain